MILKIFTVYDEKAGAYLAPFYLPTHGEAVRAFIDASMKQDHKFNLHAMDYTLFHLGTFDDAKASIDMLDVPETIGRADIMRNAHKALTQRTANLHKNADDQAKEHYKQYDAAVGPTSELRKVS